MPFFEKHPLVPNSPETRNVPIPRNLRISSHSVCVAQTAVDDPPSPAPVSQSGSCHAASYEDDSKKGMPDALPSSGMPTRTVTTASVPAIPTSTIGATAPPPSQVLETRTTR